MLVAKTTHSEENYLPKTGIRKEEYQYHLKDHLGNVRVTFTTKDETETAKATLEAANATTESGQFLRYANARRVLSSLFDRTNGTAPSVVTGYAERLNGSANEKYGLARSLSVMPGDVVSAEVYAKYIDPAAAPANGTELANLLGYLAGTLATPAGTIIDGTGYATSTSSFNAAQNAITGKTDNGAPKAYLNWLIFDRDFVRITSGFKQITTAAKEAGTDVAHERVFSPAITITQPGYVYIYLSNESAAPVDAYFDDFKVTHQKSPVIESQDYYPFGLTFNKYSRENALPNKTKLFQGQEHVDDLGLNWDSFKWRNHQPDIGRFFNVDPLAEKYVYNSPYAFSENQVVAHRELEGLEKVDIKNESAGPTARVTDADKGKSEAFLVRAQLKATETNSKGEQTGQAQIGVTIAGVKTELKGELSKNGLVAKAGVEGAAITAESKVQIGSEKNNVNVGVKLEGGAFKADANITVKNGLEVGANAGAFAGKAEGALGGTLFGVGLEVKGMVTGGSAHIGGSVQANSEGIGLQGNIGLVAGGGISIKIKY
jgi:RHS repeat-associated protein